MLIISNFLPSLSVGKKRESCLPLLNCSERRTGKCKDHLSCYITFMASGVCKLGSGWTVVLIAFLPHAGLPGEQAMQQECLSLIGQDEKLDYQIIEWTVDALFLRIAPCGIVVLCQGTDVHWEKWVGSLITWPGERSDGRSEPQSMRFKIIWKRRLQKQIDVRIDDWGPLWILGTMEEESSRMTCRYQTSCLDGDRSYSVLN